MARRMLVAGNWKMHHGPDATARYVEGLLALDLPPEVDVLLCPPAVSLPTAAMVAAAARIALGGQNVHWEQEGAFTGEISAAMLRELGIGWTLVGHSERRSLFGETDETAAARAAAAQAGGLKVVFCLGETLEQRDDGSTEAVLERQVAAVRGLDPEHLVVAYEPVWAIGTGRNATPEQAGEAHAFLRRQLAGLFGEAAANGVRILYGGSVKPGNAGDLFAQTDVDGALVGGASLDVESFSAIIRAAAHSAAGSAT